MSKQMWHSNPAAAEAEFRLSSSSSSSSASSSSISGNMEYLTGGVEAEEENVAVDVVVASALDAVVVVVEVADDGIKVTLVVVITLVSVDESTLAARLGDSVN